MKKIFIFFLFFSLGVTILPLAVDAAETSTSHYPVYRLYNAGLHDHLYTTSLDEVRSAEHIGYVQEGVLGQVYARDVYANQSAFYRLYNKKTHQHFYTDDNDELANAVIKHGYILEGTLGFLSKTTPDPEAGRIFRLFNATTGDHFYTSNWVENGMIQLSEYLSEGTLTGRLFVQ